MKADINSLPKAVAKMVCDFVIENDGVWPVPECGLNGIDVSFLMNMKVVPNIGCSPGGHLDKHQYPEQLALTAISPGQELFISAPPSFYKNILVLDEEEVRDDVSTEQQLQKRRMPSRSRLIGVDVTKFVERLKERNPALQAVGFYDGWPRTSCVQMPSGKSLLEVKEMITAVLSQPNVRIMASRAPRGN